MVSRTVLLVGMDSACAEWLETILVRRGYRVLQARNQHDAYERLSDPEGIDVILADPGTEPGFEGVSDASHLVKGTVVPLLFTLTTEQMPCVDRIGAAGQSGYLPMECGEALIDAGIQAACAARKRLGALSSEDEELRKARLIVENIPTGLYIYHLENLEDDHSLRMVYANPAVGPLAGLWPELWEKRVPGLRRRGLGPLKLSEAESGQFDGIVTQCEVPGGLSSRHSHRDPVGSRSRTLPRGKAEEALRENEERLRETRG